MYDKRAKIVVTPGYPHLVMSKNEQEDMIGLFFSQENTFLHIEGNTEKNARRQWEKDWLGI